MTAACGVLSGADTAATGIGSPVQSASGDCFTGMLPFI